MATTTEPVNAAAVAAIISILITGHDDDCHSGSQSFGGATCVQRGTFRFSAPTKLTRRRTNGSTDSHLAKHLHDDYSQCLARPSEI